MSDEPGIRSVVVKLVLKGVEKHGICFEGCVIALFFDLLVIIKRALYFNRRLIISGFKKVLDAEDCVPGLF